MRFELLGSGVAIPAPKRSPAGAVLTGPAGSILVDSGSGSIGRMAKVDVLPATLDLAFYTHLHPDHTADLVALLFALRVGGRAEGKGPLTLFGPSGFGSLVARVTAAWHPWLEPGDPPRWRVREIGPGRHEFDGFAVLAVKTEHTPESQGYRFEFDAGPVVAISGDSGPTPNLVELGRAADLLVLECSFPDDRAVAGHLTPSACADIARKAKPRRIFLTHVYPDLDEAGMEALRPLRGLPCEILVGWDLLGLDL